MKLTGNWVGGGKAFLGDLRRLCGGRPCLLASSVLLLGVLASLADHFPQYGGSDASASRPVPEWLTAPLAGARQWLFDGYQRALPRQTSGQAVVIVAIDEKSLNKHGQWPWSRDKLAALVDAVARKRPAVLAMVPVLPEVDPTSPERVAANLPASQAALAKALARLPSHEARLAQSLRRLPSVLGARASDFPLYGVSAGLKARALVVRGADGASSLRNYAHVQASLPGLQSAARGQGVLLAPRDAFSVERRVPLVVAINGRPVAGLALEMLRVAGGLPSIELEVGARGLESAQVGDLRVPLQGDGEAWLHFAPALAGEHRYLSASELLSGRIAAEKVAGKMVLVGPSALDAADWRMTALGERVPEVEIHAQQIESLLDGRFLWRPWWAKWLEAGAALLLGAALLASALRGPLSDLRRRWPAIMVFLALGFGAALVAAGFAVFWLIGLLLDFLPATVGLVCASLCLARASPPPRFEKTARL